MFLSTIGLRYPFSQAAGPLLGERASARLTASPGGHALGREAVSHTEVRVDIGPAGRSPRELPPHLPDEHVHRAVSISHLTSPYEPVDLRSRDDAVRPLREYEKRLEL